MFKLKNSPICCGIEAVWVDNVPGKEYYYCREGKHEVLAPLGELEVDEAREEFKQNAIHKLWELEDSGQLDHIQFPIIDQTDWAGTLLEAMRESNKQNPFLKLLRDT